jgi:hypothetical protein
MKEKVRKTEEEKKKTTEDRGYTRERDMKEQEEEGGLIYLEKEKFTALKVFMPCSLALLLKAGIHLEIWWTYTALKYRNCKKVKLSL